MDYIKVHYRKCLKDYLYFGMAIIILAIILLYSFWGYYTTAAKDISINEEALLYEDIEPGDKIRIHGKISEIEYFGKIDPDIPKAAKLDDGELNLTSDIYLHGLRVVDNLTVKKERIHNSTLSDLVIYNGEFSRVFLENLTFENVNFIGTSFSKVVFRDLILRNVTFIDCTIRNAEFRSVEFEGGYARDLKLSKSTLHCTNFHDMVFSSTQMRHIELYSCSLDGLRFNDSELQGVRFEDGSWDGSSFYNTTFDIIVLNSMELRNCGFPDSQFLNIFVNYPLPLDQTYIRTGDVYIRIQGDIRNFYNKGTSIYGEFRLTREEGLLEAESGEGINFTYEIFEERGIHHSIRIDGIFYIIIFGGLTSITYSFGGKAIIMALVKFFLPFVFSGIGVIVLYLALPYNTFERLGAWMVLYFFPPLGKESVIPAAIAQGISPWLVASAVAFIDIMVGLFLVWNFDLARKIPLIGGFIRRIESRGHDILKKKPWVERLAFTGLILFVMFPFQGSGAVGATIIGRMLGMDPKKIWFAVIIGAVVGCFLIAYTSAFAITFLLGIGLAYAVLSIVTVVIFILVIYNYDKWGEWGTWVREKF